MRVHSGDEALQRYAELYKRLAEPAAFDPIALRKIVHAKECNACGSKTRHGEVCGACGAAWESWEQGVPKGAIARNRKEKRSRAPGELGLTDLGTLALAWDELEVWLQRIYWLHVVVGYGYRDIVRFGLERWPTAPFAWSKTNVERRVHKARGIFEEELYERGVLRAA